jgi:hypothetical protein
LSAEATTLSESQQRTADENATLVARLDEAQQQLERAQQKQANLATSAAAVEREPVVKLQAEADIAAAIADGERRFDEQERRFAEQSQQFAESINSLERQLAAAGETRDSLARAREEVQFQLADAESQRNEQSRRIQELESQLAAAEERAAKAAELATTQLATQHAKNASHVTGDEPAEFQWPGARRDSAASSPSSLDESTTGEAAWGRPASAADAWRSAGSEVSTGGDAEERTADAWLNGSESERAAEEPNSWGKKVSPQAPVDASTFGDDDDNSPAEHTAEFTESAQRSPGWNQAAAEPNLECAEPVFAKPEESIQWETKPESGSAGKHEPTSFIERYSHLFAEDDAPSNEKPEQSNELAHARPIAPVIARLEETVAAPAKSEDEDSIEQYMAKLLQRVRGDSEGGKAAREMPSGMPLNAPTAKPAELSAENSAPPVTAAPESHWDGQANPLNDQPADSRELMKRRVSSPAPTTNLGALRALANETARMAISRHELRKLRRNAVTKTIVATLAGVTSLWLMLDSPDWRHVQFLTACGALLVAAYWAAEAFRTLLNSMRLAADEGPEDTALPIDVEARE